MREPKAVALNSVCVLTLFVMVFSSCLIKPKESSPIKNERLVNCVEKDLCTNPKLKRRGIEIWVESEKNGYVTLEVQPDDNSFYRDKPFPDKTLIAIKEGKSLREIQTSIDSSVDVLIEAEEIVKKRPDVKAVMWTARKHGEGASRLAGCEYFESQCRE